jgi:DNA invertase Pin-like site-specific DNA recombinase
VTRKPDKVLRCAIYTRKSTEHGLELEFNSLDAQREACEAYIKSQASEGWHTIAKRYDDPAYSGGNMDRPALQALLQDIETGQVDVVVVYKIDRLTRSLADFAKLVEIFDARSTSFVAITQQFNTTTSMGRLTLNVLLSFAQFERELASERVRDKVAASRKKGKWTGGSVPLGYDNNDKKLVVNPAEARTVQMIFARYLALRSFRRLIEDLNANGIVSKKRPITGRAAGGVPFTYGALAYLLKNRIYLGEIGHGGSWFPGEHEPILDQETFDKVQQLLKTNSAGRTGRRQRTGALLTGLIYDDRPQKHRSAPVGDRHHSTASRRHDRRPRSQRRTGTGLSATDGRLSIHGRPVQISDLAGLARRVRRGSVALPREADAADAAAPPQVQGFRRFLSPGPGREGSQRPAPTTRAAAAADAGGDRQILEAGRHFTTSCHSGDANRNRRRRSPAIRGKGSDRKAWK